MNTREIFEQTLDCGESALDLLVLRQRACSRDSPNCCCKLDSNSARQFLQHKPHGT
jgi:hypothetical protein